MPQPPEFPASLQTLAIQSPKVELADVVAIPPPSEEKLSWARPIPLLEVRCGSSSVGAGACCIVSAELCPFGRLSPWSMTV